MDKPSPPHGACWICTSSSKIGEPDGPKPIPVGAKEIKIYEHVKGSTQRGHTLFTLCWGCWQQVRLAVEAIRK